MCSRPSIATDGVDVSELSIKNEQSRIGKLFQQEPVVDEQVAFRVFDFGTHQPLSFYLAFALSCVAVCVHTSTLCTHAHAHIFRCSPL